MKRILIAVLMTIAGGAHAANLSCLQTLKASDIKTSTMGLLLPTPIMSKVGKVSTESPVTGLSPASEADFIRIVTTGWRRDYDSYGQAQSALMAAINGYINPELYIQFRSGWARDYNAHSQAMEAAEYSQQGKINPDLYITLRKGWARDYDAHSQAMEAAESAMTGAIDIACYIARRADGSWHSSALQLCVGQRGIK